MYLWSKIAHSYKETEMTEHILRDDYPVYPTYWYVVDDKPVQSQIYGTARDLKRAGAAAVKSCDIIKRNLPFSE